MCGWSGIEICGYVMLLGRASSRQAPRLIAGKPSPRCSSNTALRSDLARDLGLLGIQANLRAHSHTQNGSTRNV